MKKNSLKTALQKAMEEYYAQKPWIRIRYAFHASEFHQSIMGRLSESPNSQDKRMTFRDMDDSKPYNSPRWGDGMC
jgi:hypothetical protein